MLELPLDKLDILMKSLKDGIHKDMNDKYNYNNLSIFQLGNIEILTITYDAHLARLITCRNPLYLCTIKCDITEYLLNDIGNVGKKKEYISYFAFLLDMYSFRSMGQVLRIDSSGINPKFPSRYSYSFHKNGIKGMNLYARVNGTGITDYEGFTLGEFINPAKEVDLFTLYLNGSSSVCVYKRWVIDFLSRRDALLDLQYKSHMLFWCSSMDSYRREFESIKNKLVVDIQNLLDNYPWFY